MIPIDCGINQLVEVDLIPDDLTCRSRRPSKPRYLDQVVLEGGIMSAVFILDMKRLRVPPIHSKTETQIAIIGGA
jgi:hypothetical protein